MADNYGWWCHFFCCPLKMTARVNNSLGTSVHSPADIWSGLHWSSCHSAMFCRQSLNPGSRVDATGWVAPKWPPVILFPCQHDIVCHRSQTKWLPSGFSCPRCLKLNSRAVSKASRIFSPCRPGVVRDGTPPCVLLPCNQETNGNKKYDLAGWSFHWKSSCQSFALSKNLKYAT